MTTDPENANTDADLHDPASHPPRYHTRAALFESGEHSLIGDRIRLRLANGDVVPGSRKLKLDSGGGDLLHPQPVSFSHIVALAGDFFGDPDNPISTARNPKSQFAAAYEQLRNEETQVAQLVQFIDEEIAGINEARRKGLPPSSFYDGESEVATTARLLKITKGRYIALAFTNWDHFGVHAVTAYRAGHQMAVERALYARKNNNAQALEKAYTIDAFACHFLTDLFSAGHLRTPRKELYDIRSPLSNRVTTGKLAKAMHDEDSRLGLKVRNGRGDAWTAFGDKKLLDNPDLGNYGHVVNAVQASVDDIWRAFETGQPPQAVSALGLIPDLSAVCDPSDRQNHSPLFIFRNKGVDARDPLLDTGSYRWTNNWTFAGVLLQLGLG